MNTLLILLVLSCCSLVFSTLPSCNTSVEPTTAITEFQNRKSILNTVCADLCVDCVSSPRLLNALNRCLSLTVSTNEDFDELKKFNSICVLVGNATASKSIRVTKPITLGGGLNCVMIENGSSADSVIGGDGDDYVYAFNASVSEIITGDGDDVVDIVGSQVRKIETGSGRDIVEIKNGTSGSSTVDKLNVGGAGDYVDIVNSTVGSVDTSRGRDIVMLTNAVVRKVLDLGSGDDYLNITSANISKLDAGRGFNVIREMMPTNVIIGNAGSDTTDNYFCS